MPPNDDVPSQPGEDLVQHTLQRLPEVMEPIVLSVEGNIGAGKSTFLRVLHKHFGSDNIEVLQEPVHKWTECRGQNMLGAFYSDPKRYAYSFQSFAFITRLMEQVKPQTKKIRILERSGLSDYCFARNAYESGLMDDVEWAAYEEWWSFFTKHLKGGPQGVLYLHTTPDLCKRRMAVRNRSEEDGVPLEYLQQLHAKHEDWLPSGSDVSSKGSLPFIRINANVEFEKDIQAQKEMIDDVVGLIRRVVQTTKK